MNQIAFEKICSLFEQHCIPYQVFQHPECRTSEESTLARKAVGMPDAIGAKALLCKVDWKDKASSFAVFVLPGTFVLDKHKLKASLGSMKSFRFATPEELKKIAGVVPGCMPPFGSQVFPEASELFVCESLKSFDNIAFNAAKLDTSIFVKQADYFKLIKPNKAFEFAIPKN